MKSVYRWIFRHTGLCRLLLVISLLALAYTLIMNKYVPILTVYILVVLLWFPGIRFILSASDKLLEGPLNILHKDCDPDPMLAEMELLMADKKDNAQGQVTQMNYAMALSQSGRTQEALSQLQSINIDRFPSVSPYVKFVYYNNLGGVLLRLEQQAEAQIWLRKARQIYRDLPAAKAKIRLDFTAQMLDAELLYLEGNHADALHKLSVIRCDNTCDLISAAFLAARCHIALEEPEKAAEKLSYIVTHGNKLYYVAEAKALLETLS